MSDREWNGMTGFGFGKDARAMIDGSTGSGSGLGPKLGSVGAKWRGGRVLGGIVALAVLARLGAIGVLDSHRVPRSTYEHGEIAANLVEGRGFSVAFLGSEGPTSQQAPLYPALLALAYAAAGVETAEALLLTQCVQAVVGGATAAAAWWLVRAAGGSGLAAGVAGSVVALHPTLVYAATHIQVAPWAAALLPASLALGLRTARRPSLGNAALTGAALGAAMLFDPILALAAPGVALPLAARPRDGGWRGRAGRARLSALATLVLAASATLAPWTLRNRAVHGEWVFVKTTFGYAFWQGNNALSEGTDKVARASVEDVLAGVGEGDEDEDGDGSNTGWAVWNRRLWAARHEAGYIDDIALSASDRAWLGSMSEPARSRALMDRALEDLGRDPWRYVELSLRRLRYFAFFDETNPKTRSAWYRIPQLLLVGGAAWGLWVWGRRARRGESGDRGRGALVATVWAVLAIGGFHALTIVSARFQIPLQPIFAAWIGLGAGVVAGGRGWADGCESAYKPRSKNSEF